jgi:hypothetical protein
MTTRKFFSLLQQLDSPLRPSRKGSGQGIKEKNASPGPGRCAKVKPRLAFHVGRGSGHAGVKGAVRARAAALRSCLLSWKRLYLLDLQTITKRAYLASLEIVSLAESHPFNCNDRASNITAGPEERSRPPSMPLRQKEIRT